MLISKYNLLACNDKVLVFARKKLEKFKWNGLLLFFNESYLLLCFCSAINIKDMYDRPNS